MLVHCFIPVGAAITDRKYIPIIGGGLVTVSAPCYKPQADKILCKFEHVQTIGKLNSSSVGLCPLPLFSKLGQHVLWISDDDGATFNYYTVLNIGKHLYNVACNNFWTYIPYQIL